MKRLRRANKLFALLSSILMLAQSFFPIFPLITPQVFAQNVTPTETQTPTPEPTAEQSSPTPTEEIQPTPTGEVTPTPSTETSSSTTPETTPTTTPTDTATPTPGDQTQTPHQSNNEPPKETGPPEEGNILDGASTEASPSPTVTPKQPEKGILHASVLQNVEAESLDLDNIDPSNSATLSTDKADYAPTDTAIITGSQLTPEKTYSLTISSTDDPATATTVAVTADDMGTFIYSYQLDGIYRPNYIAELRDGNGHIVASTTFTDSLTTVSATVNGGSTTTVYPGAPITIAVTATVDGTNVWQNTGYKIAPALGSYDCQDTPDHNGSGTFTESFTVSAPGSVGTYNVYVRSAGASCNSGVGTDLTLIGGVIVIADTTPPVCPTPTLTSISGTHYLSGNTIYYSPVLSTTGSFKITVAPTDVGLGVQQVSFPTIATFTGGGNSDTTSLYEGTYNWFNASSNSSVDNATITCTDNAGNTSTSVFNLRKDDTQPTLTTVTLDDYTVKDGATINIDSDGADTGSGIGYCHAFWSTDTTYDSDIDLGDLGSDCDGTITVPSGAGTFYVIVRAGDNVGYFPNPVASSAVIVDNIAPNTADDTGFGGQSYFGSKTFTLTPTDTGGAGVADTQYCLADFPDTCTPDTSGTSVTATCAGASCTKWIFYYSTDNAGNSGATLHSYNFIIVNDSTAPATTDDVDGSWHNSDVTVTLACNDTGGGSCANTYYTTDGTDPTTGSSSGNSFTLSADGVYTIKYFSVDSYSNEETVKTATNEVKIDKSAPTGSITNPSSGSTIGGTIHIQATASDNSGSGISQVEFYHSSIAPQFIGTDTSAPYEFNWDTTGVSDGTHSIYVKMYDDVGNNSSFNIHIPVTVDNTSPIITIAPYNTSWTNSNITVNATTNEGTLNFASHTFSSNGSFDFIATDSVGNSTTETVTVTNIDKEVPSAPVVTTPSSNGYINSSTTQKFIWAASTDPIPGSGLATTNTYQYQIDDNSDFSSTLRNVSQTATSKTLATPLADGIYYIRVRAKDAVGNYSLWSGTIMFTVDSTAPSPPSIDSSSHSLSSWNSDRTIDVSWSAADSSGISGYSYQWSTSATTDPDTTSEGIHTSTVSGNRSTSQSIYFHIRAIDGAGNWSSTNHYGPFWVDANNPTGSWSYPLEGAVLAGNVNLQVSASDAGSDIQLVRFRYQPSGGTFVTISDDTTASYSTNWDTTSVADANYVLRARVEDNTGRYVTEDINVTVDNTPPLLASAYTRDLDGNGKIDTIEVAVNETIDHSRLASSGNDGWTVDGYTISKVDTGNGDNDTTLLLQLVEGSNPDSGNRPIISYTKQMELNSTHDLVGNQLESVSGYGTDDGAKPVVLSAETGDSDNNGKINVIKLTFSENIDDSLLNPGTPDGWDVDGYDGESIRTGSVDNDNILILSFDEGTVYDVDTTPMVNYSQGGRFSTHDLVGNQLENYSGSTTDKSSPTAPTANPVGDDYLSDQSVTLTGEPGAEIRYTTDGTAPSASIGTVYSSPILIGVDTVLKAIAIDSIGNISPVMTETYGIAPKISSEAFVRNNDTSLTVTWTTDDLSTSRVVYDTISHPVLGISPNYGYANSTVENPTKVTSHSVTITGLSTNVTYYYRVISHGSPETVGNEQTYTIHYVFGVGGGTGDGLSDNKSDGKSDGQSDGKSPLASVLGAFTSIFWRNDTDVLGDQTTDEASESATTPTPTTETGDLLGTTQKATSLPWFWMFLGVLGILMFFFWKKRKAQKPPESL